MKLAFRAPRSAALPSSRQASPSHICRAGKKQGAKKAAKVQVPNTPPPKENAPATPEQIPTEDPVVSFEEEEAEVVIVEPAAEAQAQVEQTMTAEEIGRQMSQLRAASKENAPKEGMIEVRTSLYSSFLLLKAIF
jgi:hypothetical protein